MPLRKRAHWRIPSTLIDELFAKHRANEGLLDAAHRYRVNARTMRKWFKRAGIATGRGFRIAKEETDRIVACERARPGCRTKRALARATPTAKAA
jgi:hypothetical protein